MFHFFLSAVGGRQEKKVKGKEKMERSKNPQNSGIAFCNELKKNPRNGKPFAHDHINLIQGSVRPDSSSKKFLKAWNTSLVTTWKLLEK